MTWRSTPFTDGTERRWWDVARDGRTRAPGLGVHPFLLAALAVVAPALAIAHERWVPNTPRWPINRAYFQSMTGEMLFYSLLAATSVFGVIVLWYLSAPPIIERLTPVTASAQAREAKRNFVSRGLRLLVRLALDGSVQGAFMTRGLQVATFYFAKVPAFVFGLGAYEGWLVMPSFPLSGNVGDGLRIAQAVLAVWVLSGLLQRALGVVLFAVYAYLWVEYGIAAIDAIPVLASAFFYLFSSKERGAPVNARQLLGMRVSLGVGFFMLGLINKIFLNELFIGVGDQHPDILIGPQQAFPGLTREAWSLTTALGEMVFGLLLLVGIFNRITTLLLALIFANFIFVFGWSEIVHLYPIAGFMLLFFRGRIGTALDGLVFKTNLQLFRWLSHTSYRLVYSAAVGIVAAWSGGFLMFAPLFFVAEAAPQLTGIAVPPNYKPPPPVPPAADWDKVPPPPGRATPHGDHDPRHGGVVTMVGDNHVEVVVRRDGVIQLFLTDARRTPIPPQDGRGTIRIERPGLPTGPAVKKVVPLAADATGALTGTGPSPTIAADYTYDLVIRGVSATQTLSVPPGGTDAVRRGPPVKPH